jgi:hypothetical protein
VNYSTESTSTQVSSAIAESILADVSVALSSISTIGKSFIVNDSEWLWSNPAGKLRPTVMNSAKFLSKKFQQHLCEQLEWSIEKELSGQRIDAYKEVETKAEVFSLNKDGLIKILAQLPEEPRAEFASIASMLVANYFKRDSIRIGSELRNFREFFKTEKKTFQTRIGLEFETGNIASSFRAINKLQTLFDAGFIDVGVFVTSKSKQEGAARIWPVSNRNGSFEELRQRHYHAQRSYPHIDISFWPDGYSDSAPYFDEQGCYQLNDLTTSTINGERYKAGKNRAGELKYQAI